MAESLFERIGGRPKLELFLRNFYATVRIDPLIGPIFEGVVEDWPGHLAKIAGFWSLQTGGPPDYRGGMMARHVPLSLRPGHFDAWLGLWEKSCRAHFDPPEATEMIRLAEGFRQRMEPVLVRSR
ncbi:MAG TPA: globin [Verrucomicrobiales bacterium]|nr:globin [Verrucomicrobiales bacterium]